MNKPPYRIPTMEEIRAIPWNGYKVASTFSGAGGSCTGYRMAGFKVVWANEFVPAAQASYKANAAADCHLDCRDIKMVQPEQILMVTGLKVGELDLFDGSPPCQAFSTAGKREKGWGTKKQYEGGGSQCNEQMFDQYIRLLRGLKPKVFVAENVSGLVKGTAKGYFLEILRELKASGYRVACKVLDAQWLGVPQQRTRTIFVGVREDLGLDPVHPKPLAYRYSVRDAIPWITKALVRDGFDNMQPTYNMIDDVAVCVTASGASQYSSHYVEVQNGAFPRKFNSGEQPSLPIMAGRTTEMRLVEPETDISRFSIGDEWDKLKPGQQSDKYFSLVKVDQEKPSPCIQASHGQGGIAQPLHPTIKRKFTIAEVKRICAFPDDFILCGSYAQQWERLGNSVPPLMMRAIAEEIRTGILDRIPKGA